jgi:hypothetical protein
MVAHACDPSCLGGRGREDGFEASQEKFSETPCSTKNLSVGVCT